MTTSNQVDLYTVQVRRSERHDGTEHYFRRYTYADNVHTWERIGRPAYWYLWDTAIAMRIITKRVDEFSTTVDRELFFKVSPV